MAAGRNEDQVISIRLISAINQICKDAKWKSGRCTGWLLYKLKKNFEFTDEELIRSEEPIKQYLNREYDRSTDWDIKDHLRDRSHQMPPLTASQTPSFRRQAPVEVPRASTPDIDADSSDCSDQHNCRTASSCLPRKPRRHRHSASSDDASISLRPETPLVSREGSRASLDDDQPPAVYNIKLHNIYSWKWGKYRPLGAVEGRTAKSWIRKRIVDEMYIPITRRGAGDEMTFDGKTFYSQGTVNCICLPQHSVVTLVRPCHFGVVESDDIPDILVGHDLLPKFQASCASSQSWIGWNQGIFFPFLPTVHVLTLWVLTLLSHCRSSHVQSIAHDPNVALCYTDSWALVTSHGLGLAL